MTDATGVTTYTYDAANRLTSAGGVTYTWDNRGNLVSDGTFTYTYNAAGRMVQAKGMTLTLVYTYNASGLRVAQSVDGELTTFAWDWASGIPEMLSDGEDLYLVGHETLGQWDGAAWAYYLPDALGSIRQETDGSGDVTDSREWTPFGVEAGTAQGGLGYTGEWQDSYRKFLYLRARWLDVGTGRFTSPDPIIPNYQNPQSVNRYLYALGNPVNFTDPAGLQVRPPSGCKPGEICHTGTTGPYVTCPPLPSVVCSLPCSLFDPLSWRYQVLTNLHKAGPTCRHAEEYIINNRVEFAFADIGPGAAWTLGDDIVLDSPPYSLNTNPADKYMLSLIVHEAWHLEQGVFLALSVLGELEGWQLQYDALKGELGDNPLVYNKNWDKIRNLPSPLSGPVSDDVLWKAEMLILETQDWRHYWIWALPLRPGRLGWETPPRPPMVP